jgi:hypothetical protein
MQQLDILACCEYDQLLSVAICKSSGVDHIEIILLKTT